jgi:hypothetical protein
MKSRICRSTAPLITRIQKLFSEEPGFEVTNPDSRRPCVLDGGGAFPKNKKQVKKCLTLLIAEFGAGKTVRKT